MDSLALNKHGFKRLDTQTVQCRCTVEQYRMVGDDFLKDIPDYGIAAVHHTLRALHILCILLFHKALDDKRLEKLQSHRLRQAALMHAQARPHNDHGTPGIIHTLAQKVLAETPLLALEHIGKRLERTVRCACNCAPAASVVEEGINSFLEHALFIIKHNLRCMKLNKTLQTVIAVDHAAVQVVKVRCCETAAVKLDHRPQVRRDDRDNIQDHICRALACVDESHNDFQPLQGTGLALPVAVFHIFTQLGCCTFEIEILKTLLYSFCTHAAVEIVAVTVFHFAPQVYIAFHIARLQSRETVPYRTDTGDLVIITLADRLQVTLCTGMELSFCLRVGIFRLKRCEILFKLPGTLVKLAVAAVAQALNFRVKLSLKVRKILLALLLIDRCHHISGEINHFLQVFRGNIQQIPQPAWHTGAASSIWPIRSRRTRERVTSTPQRSHTMPLNRTRLYLPQAHSQSRVGPNICSPNRPSFSGLRVR